MTPTLWAFLSVWASRDSFPNDPEMILSVLEGREDIWGKTGTIDGRQGMIAVKEFLLGVAKFDALTDDDLLV